MESNEDISSNILNLRSSSIKNSLLGKRRACSTITRYEWTFLILVILTLAIVLGVILFRLSYLSAASSDFSLAIILLINILFCYAYSCHGVLFEQPYEILLLVISTVIILVYTILSYHIGDVHDTIKTAKFVYTLFVGPIIIVTGLQIGCNYRQSGNLIFRTVGGDPFMQSICRKAQLQCVLLLFDMQAIINCLVLIIHAANVSSLQETVVLAMGSVFTIGWTILGYLTVRFESIACLGMFLVLGTVQPSYIVWQSVNAGLFQTDSSVLWSVSVSGAFFLVLRMYLIVNTLCVYKNFGKGLREKIYGNRRSNSWYGTFGEAAHS